MSDDQPFAEFIRRIRSGDAAAAAELIRRYELEVRLEVRMRLTDPRLRRQFDSVDICQSVLASFFVRAVAGSTTWKTPASSCGSWWGSPATRWRPRRGGSMRSGGTTAARSPATGSTSAWRRPNWKRGHH
jgi:hypothetical protein